MSFRGRGRGRGGFGGGGFRPAKQVPFELFPEIEGLGTAKYSTENTMLIKWSMALEKYSASSCYHYEDRNERPDKAEKPDIERYSDRKLQAKKAKQPLSNFIRLDQPAELARGEKNGNRVPKRVRWNPESDFQKLDVFEKLEQKHQGQEGNEKKENEEEEEEEEDSVNDEDGEFSDDDYAQAAYCDDDEDDFNMPEENNDEGYY